MTYHSYRILFNHPYHASSLVERLSITPAIPPQWHNNLFIYRREFIPVFHVKHSRPLIDNPPPPIPRIIPGTSIHQQAYNRSDSNNPFIYRREFIPVFHVKHSRHCHASSQINNPRDNTYRTATIATSHYHALYHRHIFSPLFHVKHSRPLIHNPPPPPIPRIITGTSIHEQAYNRNDSNNPFIYRRECIPLFHVKHDIPLIQDPL